jgi:hypothetical protein
MLMPLCKAPALAPSYARLHDHLLGPYAELYARREEDDGHVQVRGVTQNSGAAHLTSTFPIGPRASLSKAA